MATTYFTVDHSSGSDQTVATSKAGHNDSTTIYDDTGHALTSALDVNGYNYISTSPSSWSLNGTTTDTLIATSGDDLVVWDQDATSGLFSGSPAQRLYAGTDGSNRDFEVFDLRGGDDILNLTNKGSTGGYYGGSDSSGYYTWGVTAYGGAGNDVLAGGNGPDVLYGDGSTDGSSVTPGNDTLFGTAGGDTLFGDNGSTDPLETVGGNDTIYDGADADTIYGEGGNDYITAWYGGDTVFAGGGDDTVDSSGPLDSTVYGGTGNDRLISGDIAYGGDGNDWIDGGYGGVNAGFDTLYGDAGNDTIYGYDAGDTLYGGAGDDSLYGGTENDILVFSEQDHSSTTASVRIWDGIAGDAAIVVGPLGGGQTQYYSNDYFDGGTGNTSTVGQSGEHDTLLLGDGNDIFATMYDDVSTTGTFGNVNTSGDQRLTGIEIILAGAGADIISLNHLDTDGTGPDKSYVFSSNITIAGEAGADTIVSGSGNDLIFGDALNNFGTTGVGDGNDVIYGGGGTDTIYGGGGDDTIYASGNDLVYGGEGNDVVYGSDLNSFQSENGADLVVLNFTNSSLAMGVSNTGTDDPSDGADRVFTTGNYASTTMNLGGGNDLFIGSDSTGSGNHTDIINGQSGNDALAGWVGNDTLAGDSGQDALWGGVGADTIYGGDGTDYLYGGPGNGDVLYGGAGVDYYYWARTDGTGDQIWDQVRVGGAGAPTTAENYLVVFPTFDPNDTVNPNNGGAIDFLANGQGVYETDHNITDQNAGSMVYVYDLDGSGPGQIWRLEILSGAGAGNYVDFNHNDISAIALWNSDAAAGTNAIQLYQWDDAQQTYVYQS